MRRYRQQYGGSCTPSITVLCNPASGHGRAERDLPWVLHALRSQLPGHCVISSLTHSWADATRKAATVVAAHRHTLDFMPWAPPDVLLMMGGDGMASIGANACAGNPDMRLGVIPAGTGNDFCRGMGLPTDIRTAISAIIDGNCKQVDLMDVRGELTRQQHSRYVASVVSTGYDAQVNARTNAHKVSIGSLTYGFEAIRQMTEFAPLQYSLEIDGVRRDLEAILVAVANAGVYGGGVQICPSSDPADGLLDITIIHPASRLEFCSAIPKLYSGKLDEHPKVEILHARRIRISGPDLTPMADGEELGSFPLDIRIAPGVLQLVGATA